MKKVLFILIAVLVIGGAQNLSFSNEKENEILISEDLILDKIVEYFLTYDCSPFIESSEFILKWDSFFEPLVEDDIEANVFCGVTLDYKTHTIQGMFLLTYEKASKLLAVKLLCLSDRGLPSARLIFDVMEHPGLSMFYPEVKSILEDPQCHVFIKPTGNNSQREEEEWTFFVSEKRSQFSDLMPKKSCTIPISFSTDGKGGTFFQIHRK